MENLLICSDSITKFQVGQGVDSMYKNRDWYYWILFSVILFFISYFAYFIAVKFYLSSSYIGLIIGVMAFLVFIIPVSTFLASLLMKFIMHNKIDKKSSFKFIIAIIIILPIGLVAITNYNEYKVKNLENILRFDPTKVESMSFIFDGNIAWENSDVEASKELYNFLSQYKVKKMRNNEWDGDVSKETGFIFTASTKSAIIIVSVFENRLMRSDAGHYLVTNGPIDMEWIVKYNEKYN